LTYEEKKAWLWRYRSAKRFERLRLDELATLEAEACHTTQRYSPTRGGGGDGQTLPRSVERIDEARREAAAQSAVCDAIRAEIMDVFSQLDDEVDFMILFRRYILLEDWPDIAVIVRISRSQMFQRHSAAIKRLDIKSPD
jgi:DNA-directed RNA polymerase specialized sigma subunit